MTYKRRRCGGCSRPYTRKDNAYELYCQECRDSAAEVLKREEEREAKALADADAMIARTRAKIGLGTR